MKFSYTALTADNKKVTGVLDVENEDAAKNELHKMGVAIISVKEISDADYEKLKKETAEKQVESGIKTYTFVAIDTNNQEVEGTIDAKDEYTAYKRLRTEYKFKVNNLFPSEATDQEKGLAKGKIEGFSAQLDQELIDTGQATGEDEDQAEKGSEEVSKELIKEIDQVIINTKKVLEVHKDFFSMELIKEIQNTLGELERVRTSNNIKHITEVSNNLYELVSNPDKANGQDENESYKAMTSQIGDSALVKKEFELYKKAVKMTGAKKLFDSITNKLKDLTSNKEKDVSKPKGILSKLKDRFHSSLEKLSAKKPKKKKETKSKTRLGIFFETLNDYFKTNTPVLKRTRKKEIIRAFKNIFKKQVSKEETAKKPDIEKTAAKEGAEIAKKAKQEEAKAKTEDTAKTDTKTKKKLDLTQFFVELDSFIGWLLSFYIIYFFLIDFSLEKNIGLGREFVFKTLSTPLILNITIFLLIFHFALRLKNLHFRKNFFAALFLICLSIGIYTLLIVNF